MNDNKKPSELLEIKELLTHQLQLVSKESEEDVGRTEFCGCRSGSSGGGV